MSGSKKGSARCLRRGSRKPLIRAGSLNPRFSKHCATNGDSFKAAPIWLASKGCGGAKDQRNFITLPENERSVDKFQMPNSKLQTKAPNSNVQAPTQSSADVHCELEFILEFGIWNLEFGMGNWSPQ